MSILITADPHLDLWTREGRDPFAGIVPVLRDLDALVIAGDLANSSAIRLRRDRVMNSSRLS